MAAGFGIEITERFVYLGAHHIRSRPVRIFRGINRRVFELFLENGQISTQFFLKIGSKKIPDMLLRVDPRRKKVLGISKFKKKIAQINYFLRIL